MSHNGAVAPSFVVVLGALVMAGVLFLLLRWTFGTGRDQVAPHLPDPDDPTGDGLLQEVTRTGDESAAGVLRSRLRAAGIRATIGKAEAGAFRLLVFPRDAAAARDVLRRPET